MNQIQQLIDFVNQHFDEDPDSVKSQLGFVYPKTMDYALQKELCIEDIHKKYPAIYQRPFDLPNPKIIFKKEEDKVIAHIKSIECYTPLQIVYRYGIPPHFHDWKYQDELIDEIIQYQTYIYELDLSAKEIKIDKNLRFQVDNDDETIFSEYKVIPALEASSISQHPSKVIECESLYNIPLPLLEESFSELIENRKWTGLSTLQVETILYASSNHERRLSTGERKGFLISDSTGIGKGRQISGIISYHYDMGRKKSLWVSVSNTLVDSCIRDFRDIEREDIKIIGLPLLSNRKIPEASGVMFVTYKKLIALGNKKTKHDRISQICDWLGEDFQGVIVFDECHSAKNFSLKNGSKTGKIVYELQKRYPEARIVYSSASSASEIKHLEYMYRLGLWDRLFSNDFNKFKKCIQSGGLGALELLMCELKRSGSFCSRCLSYEGTNFETVEIQLTDEEKEMYAHYVEIWFDIFDDIQTLAKHDAAKLSKKIGAFHQRFFLHLILHLKVKKCVEIARESLENDKSVVIGLFSTGENALKRCKDDEFSTLKDMMVQMIQGLPSGKILSYKISKIHFPKNPMDDIIQQLGGHDKVCEISGRNHTLIMENGIAKMISRNSEKDNMEEMRLFQSGAKKIAIITEAASVGISLNATQDTKKRVHIILQLPWSAEKAMQQLGRTHRSNQTHAPEYKFLFSNLAGEKRLISEISSRITMLGALSNGDRRSSSGNKSFHAHILCPEISKETIAHLSFHDCVIPTNYEIFKSAKPLKNFLNKLLGLEPDHQEKLFNQFLEIYDQKLALKKKLGVNLYELQTIKEEPILIETIYQPMNGGEETKMVTYQEKGCVIVGPVILFVEGIIETLTSMKNYDRSIFGGLQIVFVFVENKYTIGTLFPLNLKKPLIHCITKQVDLMIKKDFHFLHEHLYKILYREIIQGRLHRDEIEMYQAWINEQYHLFQEELKIQLQSLDSYFKTNKLVLDHEKKKRILHSVQIRKIRENFIVGTIRLEGQEEELNHAFQNLIYELDSYMNGFKPIEL